ncbi:protein lifeguard 1 isoform X2 [Salvelinus namaycush]|uniref:Protein lifeguard 1 isoform X2 n=1 Tax=Salvelinus namaycush TaxID=8040 RepID=A0A8U1BU42_SALNM|nr:protein lifeguard 1 isoform X2 [Salvelinus namaycush]
MTDAQNYSMPTESQDALNSNLPPPYPHGETQVDHMPPYIPPPYSAAPAMYPPSPNPPVLYPPQAGVDMGTLPPGECNPLGEPGSSSPEADAALLVSSFDDKTIRKAFIRKVFSVVTLQLLVTFSIVCVFTFSSVVRAAVQSNIWIYLSSYILFAVVAISLSYSNSFSRSHPWNLVGLSVVTLTLSYLVGTVASFHDTTAVVIAMGATVAISFTIIIFSAQTRVDFTICNGILLVLAVDLLMFSFFCCFFYSNVLQIVYGSLGALLFSLFLAIDCQLVMGRQKYALDPEET